MKDPMFAAVLNIIPGLGYVYLGQRKIFSYLLLLAVLLGTIDIFVTPYVEEDIPVSVLSTLSYVVFAIAFITDAYLLGKLQRADFLAKNKISKK